MKRFKSIIKYFFKNTISKPYSIILFSLLFLVKLILQRNIMFANYVQSEIGSATWLDSFLRKRSLELDKSTVIFFITGSHQANSFFEKLRRKAFKDNQLIFIKNKILYTVFKPVFIYENKFLCKSYSNMSFEEYQRYPIYDWLGKEKEKYHEELKSFFNMKKDDWFVCFFTRDSLYDDLHRPSISESLEIRNANVASLIESMEYIVSKGGYAIRIGSWQKNQLATDTNHRIIDYSFYKNRNSKIDVLLMFFCEFCIGTGSGILDLANLNNRPLGLINHYEYIVQQGQYTGNFIPKLFKRKNNNACLTYNEYLKLIPLSKNIQQHRHRLEELGLYLKDNSSEDILEITKQFYNHYKMKNIDNNLKVHFNKNGLKINKNFFDKYLIN